MHLFMFSTPHLPMFLVYCSSHQCMLHLSLRTCTVAAYNFLSANLLCSAVSLLFFISCATWLDSIGSNGISMIQKSMNLYFGKYILEIGIEQNLAVLGAEWEQTGKQNHPKSLALSYLPTPKLIFPGWMDVFSLICICFP